MLFIQLLYAIGYIPLLCVSALSEYHHTKSDFIEYIHVFTFFMLIFRQNDIKPLLFFLQLIS